MAVGQKTTEVDAVEGMPVTAELLGNFNKGTARFPVDKVPQLSTRRVTAASGQTINVTEAEHFDVSFSVNNISGPVIFNLPDSDTVLVNETGASGDSLIRGGEFCTFVISSGNFPVQFNGVNGANNLRAGGMPFQTPKSVDTVYVGASPAAADEAIVVLYKRGGVWTLHCSSGWRTTEDGNELGVSGAQLKKELNDTNDTGVVISDDNHQIPVWLTNAAPGTLTLAAVLTEGLTTSIVNGGNNPVTIDFTGHVQVGSVNSIGASEAATLIAGPISSGTSRLIIVKASG